MKVGAGLEGRHRDSLVLLSPRPFGGQPQRLENGGQVSEVAAGNGRAGILCVNLPMLSCVAVLDYIVSTTHHLLPAVQFCHTEEGKSKVARSRVGRSLECSVVYSKLNASH